jgi:hypothetical protein
MTRRGAACPAHPLLQKEAPRLLRTRLRRATDGTIAPEVDPESLETPLALRTGGRSKQRPYKDQAIAPAPAVQAVEVSSKPIE